jgi:hypothetical protein
MNHGRTTVLEATHKARFMKDGMSNVMDVNKSTGEPARETAPVS